MASGALDLDQLVYGCHLLELSLAHVAHVRLAHHAVLMISGGREGTVRLVLLFIKAAVIVFAAATAAHG